MEPPPEITTAPRGEDDGWELCNDDGFIYHRKKRRRLEDPYRAAGNAPDPADDTEAEERNRKERKKRILLKLKRKYEREIHAWESLWSSLNAMKGKAALLQIRREEEGERTDTEKTTSFLASSSGGGREQNEDASTRPSLLDELLFMAETQEAVIRNVSNLCDVAEEMCKEQEEQLKQHLFDLPVWGSPRELMLSLCDE